MIRTALSALLLAAAIAPAAAQLAPTPVLKRDVTVTSELVRIGDLIENAGPAAATPIFRAPDLGRVGALPAQRVLDAVLPDAPTRELLGVAADEPLLRLESIAYGANGRPIEHYQALHRCQASRLHVKTTT